METNFLHFSLSLIVKFGTNDSLSLDQFKSTMQYLYSHKLITQKILQKQLQKLFKTHNLKKTNKLSWLELDSILKNPKLQIKEHLKPNQSQLQNTVDLYFFMCNQNSRQQIAGKEELDHLFRILYGGEGIQIDKGKLDRFIKKFDKNGDMNISRQELYQGIKKSYDDLTK